MFETIEYVQFFHSIVVPIIIVSRTRYTVRRMAERDNDIFK